MNEIIVDSNLVQTRVAVLEDKQLVELYVEREDHKKILGNIYKGRVTNVLPGMEAAFVDIGLERNAFLYVKDAMPYEKHTNHVGIKDVVKNGQELIVQVVKEPVGTKGARITTHLTLPGRYVVLTPDSEYIGISRRITQEEERDRLRRIVQAIKPKNMGVIIRTVAEDADEKELQEDISFLTKLLKKIQQQKYLGSAPKMVHQDLNLLHRVVRDLFTSDVDRFVVDDDKKYEQVLQWIDWIAPHLKERVVCLKKDMFNEYGIESMIKNAVSRKVWLKSGGYLIIEQTEAMTIIDVNTGKYVGNKDLEDTIFNINKEAAQEIAKQLRLRDIGGIIIVDFIDMLEKNAQNELVLVLQKSLQKDRTRTNVLGITQLGLIEMTRKKSRKRIGSFLLKKCPYCEGTGKILSEYILMEQIEKQIKRMKAHTNVEAVILEVSHTIREILENSEQDFLSLLYKEYGIRIFLQINEQTHDDKFVVKDMGKEEKMMDIIQNKQ